MGAGGTPDFGFRLDFGSTTPMANHRRPLPLWTGRCGSSRGRRMAQMLINLWFLHAFRASAVGGDVLSERWANARRTFPQLRRNESGERVCRMWGAVKRVFGAIFHDFGAFGADLGAMLGSFWGRLEVIWRFRGPNGWRAASWGALGAPWGQYGGHLGPFLGPSKT